MTAISLHIGLNKVDAEVYGTPATLKGCHNDAMEMEKIAISSGYSSKVLLDDQASSNKVSDEIDRVSKVLNPGDCFLLTYAGHGSQVVDITSDEEDGRDETWVLYDRIFIDDELLSLFGRFQKGVKILIISDSCHSGTVARIFPSKTETDLTEEVYRMLDPEIAQGVYDRNRNFYASIKRGATVKESDINASVVLISGCQDYQLSADGVRNGLFTSKLMDAWNNGRFSGDYRAFHSSIRSRMPNLLRQEPNLLHFGSDSEQFLSQRPFSIG